MTMLQDVITREKMNYCLRDNYIEEEIEHFLDKQLDVSISIRLQMFHRNSSLA